ncbi:ribonuclease Z [Shimazuella sp. AN120528]|uniref:ribonuclease Z n=1 Tax=Shimazuella soli TaxID=1892854 RepID=UPI001F0DE4C9|nr:ribonuclease Z [Shimazuella soli]MCH5586406.1 ribonuclease Z [Shimazuella soli]
MKLYFLGTSAGVPTNFRNVSSLALLLPEYNGDIWLFDCGEATQHQIMKSPIKLSRISRIFITHLHGDHIYGLPGLLSTRSFQTESPLTIYGPRGIKEFIEVTLSISETHLSHPIDYVEILDEMTLTEKHFTIRIKQLEHRITCFGFRIEENDKPGKLNTKKLLSQGIKPGPIFQKIKRGELVILPDGRQIDGKQFIDAPTPGKIVTILGDTLPCQNSIILARNADLLVHEATQLHKLQNKASQYFHSTTIEAAFTAQKAEAKQLIINHLSPRYHEVMEDDLIEEVRSIFPNAQIANEHQFYEI